MLKMPYDILASESDNKMKLTEKDEISLLIDGMKLQISSLAEASENLKRT